MPRLRRVSWSVICVGLVLVALPAPADMPFADAHGFAFQDGASSVAVADFDRDGFQDVVIASIESDTVQIRFGAGPHYVVLATDFDRACFVIVADVDADGWIDVVGGRRGTGTDQVTWWRNPGAAGSWSAHPVSGTFFDQARGLDAADLDRDGDIDLLVAGVDSGNGYVSWFENTDGTGTTWMLHDITTGFTGAHDVDVADVNGDGLPDVVAAAYDLDLVAWFENDGSITSPGNWNSHLVLDGLDGAVCVDVADMDQDGDLDVVAGAYRDDEVVWVESNGGVWTPHVVTTTLDGVYTAEPVDLDRDGDLDLVATGRETGELVWYERTASTWIARPVGGTVAGARSATAVDFDDDGDLDLVAAAEFDDHGSWWENLSHHRRAAFTAAGTLTSGVDHLYDLIIVDVDRDGSPDILDHRRSEPAEPDIVIWRQTTGSWGPTPVVSDFDGPTDVVVEDLDGDGDLDLAAIAIFSQAVAWFEGDGGGGFTKHVLATGYDGRSIEAGDLDCDGDLDLVSTLVSGPDATLWWNNGDGSGWVAETLTTTYDHERVWIRDLVGDAAPDLVFGSSWHFWEVWENRLCSGGGWAPDVIAGIGMSDVAFGDFDGDGRTDFAAVEVGLDTVSVYLDPGTWTRHDLTTSHDGADEIRAADMDLDGDVDLVTTAYYDGEVTWWENDGTGTGWTERLIAAHGHPEPLAVGDLDLDGDPDVVTGNWLADELYVYDNTGGQFGAQFAEIAPAGVGEGETVGLFSLEYAGHGRAGDLSCELRRVLLALYTAGGDPLTPAQGADLFASAKVWFDGNDNGVLEPGVDPEVYSGAPTVIAGGYVDILVDPSVANPDLAGGAWTARFFVGLETTADAADHEPESFRAIAYSNPSSAFRYADHPWLSLGGEPWSAAQTAPIVILAGFLFADEFESGDLSLWSSSVP